MAVNASSKIKPKRQNKASSQNKLGNTSIMLLCSKQHVKNCYNTNHCPQAHKTRLSNVQCQRMLPEDTLNNQKFTKYLTNFDTDHRHFVKLKADNKAARCYSESGRNRLRRNMQAFQQLGWYQPAGRDVIPLFCSRCSRSVTFYS